MPPFAYLASNSLPDYTTGLWRHSSKDKLLSLFQIQGFAPLGFSQQYETQQNTPEKVLYVEGAWCCNFLFRVEATQRDLQDEWSSVEVRVCSATILNTIRQTCLPTIFQIITSLDAPWISILQDIASDPEESSRGLLGHFSSLQMERIERLFAPVGETDPWGTVINPLWAVILGAVERVWRSAKWTRKPERRALVFGAGGYASFTRGERQGARHSGKHAVFSNLVPRPDPCLSRCTTFRTGAEPVYSPLLGTRGGAGAPEHQRSEASSTPRAPSPRVVSCPTCGTGQMSDSQLFA